MGDERSEPMSKAKRTDKRSEAQKGWDMVRIGRGKIMRVAIVVDSVNAESSYLKCRVLKAALNSGL